MANYEDILIDSIELIAKNAVDNAHYDQTIQASVVRCIDEEAGAYIVKYQDAKFEAYSANLEEVYTSKDQVYVLIPGNNMSAHKTIIGKVKNTSQVYSTAISEDKHYVPASENIIILNKEIGICSYATEPIISDIIKSVSFEGGESYPTYLEDTKGLVLYDRGNNNKNFKFKTYTQDNYILIVENGITVMTINKKALETAFNGNDKYLKMGGTFRTNLSEEQTTSLGNYGLYIEVEVNWDKDPNLYKIGYIMDTSNMTGTPLAFIESSEQIIYKDLKVSGLEEPFRINDITKIIFFQENFKPNETIITNDIFLSEIVFQAMLRQVWDDQGFWFGVTFEKGGKTVGQAKFTKEDDDKATIKLTAVLKRNGEDIPSNEITYYWFNGTADEDDKIYKKVNLSVPMKCIQEDGLQSLTIKKSDIFLDGVIYGVGVIYNGIHTFSMLCTVYNEDANYSFDWDVTEPFKLNQSSRDGYYIWTDSNKQGTITAKIFYKKEEIINDLIKNPTYKILKVGQVQETITSRVCTLHLDANFGSKDNSILFTCQIDNKTIGPISIGLKRIQKTGITLNLIAQQNGEVVGKNAPIAVLYNYEGELETPYNAMSFSFSLTNDDGDITKDISEAYYFIGAKGRYDKEYKMWKASTQKKTIFVDGQWQQSAFGPGGEQVSPSFDLKKIYDEEACRYLEYNIICLGVLYQGEAYYDEVQFQGQQAGGNGTNGRTINGAMTLTIKSNLEKGNPFLTEGTVFAINLGINYEGNEWFKAILKVDNETVNPDSLTWGFFGEGHFQVENVKENGKIKGLFSVINRTIEKDDYSVNDILYCTATKDNQSVTICVPIAVYKYFNNYSNESHSITDGLPLIMYDNNAQNPTPSTASIFHLDDINVNWKASSSANFKLVYSGKTATTIQANELYNETSTDDAIIGINEASDFIIHIPIYVYSTSFIGSTTFGNWGGKEVLINVEDGYIYARTVFAGVKNAANQFTGISIGESYLKDGSKNINGLVAYDKGQRTFILNAETGATTIGRGNIGTIEFEPDKEASITSGSYKNAISFKDKAEIALNSALGFSIESYLTEDGKVDIDALTSRLHKEGRELTAEIQKLIQKWQKASTKIDRQGMQIKFGLQPSIVWGNGNFSVNAKGSLIAKSATIEGNFSAYNPTALNQSYIYLKNDGIQKSEIRFFDYEKIGSILTARVIGETYITSDEFRIAAYDNEDIVTAGTTYSTYNLDNPSSYFKYKNGKITYKGEFENITRSSDVAFKNNPSSTHIKFVNFTEKEDTESENKILYIKNTSEWTTNHLYMYNYDDMAYREDAETKPEPKGYFKYNNSGLAMKGTFSAQTDVSKIRFSDKVTQNYIKFIDREETENGTIIKAESEWSPRRFSLKTYGPNGKNGNDNIVNTQSTLDNQYESFLKGDISENAYLQAEAQALSNLENEEDSDDVISSLVYSNGVLKYKGGIRLAAPPYAKLNIDATDGKSSVLEFKSYSAKEEAGESIDSNHWVSYTKVAPGEFSVRTREDITSGRPESELSIKNGKIRLKGEIEMETPIAKVRLTKDSTRGNYIQFNDIDEETKQINGKQRMAPDMFRLATYNEDGQISSSFKLQDGKMRYRGDMIVKTEKGIFNMSQDKMLLRVADEDDQGRKTSDFRISTDGFAFRAYGPRPKSKYGTEGGESGTTQVLTYSTAEPDSEGIYNNIEVYGADFIPDDNVSIETIKKIDSLLAPSSKQEINIQNEKDWYNSKEDAIGNFERESNEETYKEYTVKWDEEEQEEYVVENSVTENYEELNPVFMKDDVGEDWGEISALVYDVNYKKLRLNGNLTVRNDHGSIILTDDMMRMTFKSFEKDAKGNDIFSRPKTRMCIAEDSFYFYGFGSLSQYSSAGHWLYDENGIPFYKEKDKSYENKEGVATGIIYEPDTGLRVIGEIQALSGYIGGWKIAGSSLSSFNNNISLNSNGSITAGRGTKGAGAVIESKYEDKRCRLVGGEMIFQRVSFSKEVIEDEATVLSNIESAQITLKTLCENKDFRIRGVPVTRYKLNNKNNVKSSRILFDYPSSPDTFYNNPDGTAGWKGPMKVADEEIQNGINTYYDEIHKLVKDHINNLKQDLDPSAPKMAWPIKIKNTSYYSGWGNFGVIFSGRGSDEGLNIGSEGYRKQYHVLQENFYKKQSETTLNTYDESYMPRGIYINTYSNAQAYDSLEESAVRKLIEGKEEGSTIYRTEIEAEMLTENEGNSNIFRSPATMTLLNYRVENEENKIDWDFLKDEKKVYDSGSLEYDFLPYVSQMGFIIGKTKNTKESEDESDAVYLYGTEILPHVVKTNDIYLHNYLEDPTSESGKAHWKKGIGFRSTSLMGILQEIRDMPISIEWHDAEDNKNAYIKETWNTKTISYDSNYKMTSNAKLKPETVIWEVKIEEVDGEEQVTELILKGGNNIYCNEEDITIQISGFDISL